MKTQIQNYRNLMALSDFYLASNDNKSFIQQLMWIEVMLDRAKTEIAVMSSSASESELSRAFTKEVYQYLDIAIRPKITDLIKSMSEEEKVELVASLKFSSSNEIQWVGAS